MLVADSIRRVTVFEPVKILLRDVDPVVLLVLLVVVVVLLVVLLVLFVRRR